MAAAQKLSRFWLFFAIELNHSYTKANVFLDRNEASDLIIVRCCGRLLEVKLMTTTNTKLNFNRGRLKLGFKLIHSYSC